MFDTLSERLQAALSDVRSRGKLTEEDISKAMRAIRLALLEADVNFQVVKSFTAQVKERALGEAVAQSLTPGQMVTKIVSDELPQIYLWYPANVLIARKRVGNIQLDPSGSWYFIAKLTLDAQ